MATKKKPARPTRRRNTLKGKPNLPHLSPDERPFSVSFMSSENTFDKRKRRFFIALQIALGQLTPDDMDKIEPILRDAIGRHTIKAYAVSQGHQL